MSHQRSFSDDIWELFSLFQRRSFLTFQIPPEDQLKKVCSNYQQWTWNSNICTKKEVEYKDEALEMVFETASKVSYLAKYNKKALPPWWNADLPILGKLTTKVFNIFYGQRYWQSYKDCLKATMNRSRSSYCKNIISSSEFTRVS